MTPTTTRSGRRSSCWRPTSRWQGSPSASVRWTSWTAAPWPSSRSWSGPGPPRTAPWSTWRYVVSLLPPAGEEVMQSRWGACWFHDARWCSRLFAEVSSFYLPGEGLSSRGWSTLVHKRIRPIIIIIIASEKYPLKNVLMFETIIKMFDYCFRLSLASTSPPKR